MKTHKFDVEDAEKYGIEKAILLEHLKFHQEANQGNDDLEFDGKTYAFIKPETIKQMYPYLSYKSVLRWLSELEEDGIIESMKPHAKQGNHLKYYHVVGHSVSNSQNEKSNSQKQEILNSQNESSSILPNEEPSENTHKPKIPSISDVREYFKENGYDPDVGEKAFHYYNVSVEENPNLQYWRDSKGNKVRSWKQKMRAVWFKDENKLNGNEPTKEELERRYRLKPE